MEQTNIAERQKQIKQKRIDFQARFLGQKNKSASLSYNQAEQLLEESDYLLLSQKIKLLGASRKKLYYPLVTKWQKHWHFEVRAAVAYCIGLMRDQRGLDVLQQYLIDKSKIVRWEAKVAMIQLAHKDAIAFYHKCLKDPCPAIQLMTAQCLEELLDASNSMPLQNAFRGAETSVKVGIIAALSKNNFPSSLKTLEEALIRESSPEIKTTSLLHLSSFPRANYLQLFASYLQNPNLIVRLAAIQAIQKLGYPSGAKFVTPFVSDANPLIRSAVARALGSIGQYEHLEFLLHFIKDKVARVRIEAVVAMGKMKYNEAVPALTHLTQDPDPSVRSAVAFALYGMDERNAVNPGIVQEAMQLNLHALESGSIAERREALKNLVVYQDLSQAGEKIACMLDDHDMEVRRLAIRALAVNESVKIHKRLADRFSDKEMMVRWELAHQFSEVQHTNFLQGFHKFLSDPVESIRIRSIQHFLHQEKGLSSKALQICLQDKSEIVRWYGLMATWNNDDQDLVRMLKAMLSDLSPDIRFHAALKLMELGCDHGVANLIENLNNPEPEFRRLAAISLSAQLPKMPYVKSLYRALKDEDVMVRRLISANLMLSLTPKDLPSITPYLQKETDPTVFRNLASLLFQDNASQANFVIEKILQNQSHPNRSLFIEMLFEQSANLNNYHYYSLLQEADVQVRERAVAIIGQTNPQQGIKKLIEHLKAERDTTVQLSILQQLDKHFLAGAKEVFVGFLNHPNKGIHQFAHTALKKRGL